MKKRVLLFACLAGAMLLAAAANALYSLWTRPETLFEAAATPSVKPTAMPTDAPRTPTPEEALLAEADRSFMEGRVNILLLGYDQSPERDDPDSTVHRDEKNNYRSDVLLLAAVNFREKTVHLISIPRDTYAEIYNTRGRWKINAAFAKGGAAEGDGFTYAVKTVEMLMGVPIDCYAGVNMEGIKRLVDAIGGVDYDVDVKITLDGRTLETGFQHLDGQQVLDYMRARKGISTDAGRNDRQQRILLAIFDQLKREKRITELPKLYAAVREDIETNLTVSQIAALAVFMGDLDLDGIKRTTLAGEYISNVYNASYYVLYNKKLIELVKEEFGVTITRDKKYDVAYVKRDKAAAEAKKAAEEAEKLADEAAKTTLMDGSPTGDARLDVYFYVARVEDAVESGSMDAILSARHKLNTAVREFALEQGLFDLPDAFSALALE